MRHRCLIVAKLSVLCLYIIPCLQDRGVPALGGRENGSLASQGRAGGLFAGVDEGGEVHPHQGCWGRFNKADSTAYPSVSDGQRIPRHPEDFWAWSLTSGRNQRMEPRKVSPGGEVVKLPSLHL